MGNSCNHEMRRSSRKIPIATRGGDEDICQNMFTVREREYMSSQGFLHILNSKVIQQYHTAMAQLTVTINVSCVTPYLCITLQINNCHRTVLFHSRCHNIFCFATQNTKTFR